MLTKLNFRKVDKVRIGKVNDSYTNYTGPEFREITLYSQDKSFTITVWASPDKELIVEVDGIYGDI